MAAVQTPECLDFLQFQDILKKMRELDDKIIYTLNVNLPTESFRGQSNSSNACKELYGKLQDNFEKREKAIKKCINFSKDKVIDLKKQKDLNSDDVNILKALRKEQSKKKQVLVALLFIFYWMFHQHSISVNFSNHKCTEKYQKRIRKISEIHELKLLQTELGVEEVVKDKTSKIFYERCRMHYVPPNFSL